MYYVFLTVFLPGNLTNLFQKHLLLQLHFMNVTKISFDIVFHNLYKWENLYKHF